jgi:hypothetical protein
MRGALRPAIAVLLLVGVGVTVAAKRAAGCPLSRCCAMAAADADARPLVDLDGAPVARVLAPVRHDAAPVVIATAAPPAPALATHLLADAPKTSPPTA